MDYNNDNPHKIKKERQIHAIQQEKPIKWSDLKNLEMEDDDILQVGYDEGHYSENNSWDAHYFAIVTRMVEETDEQRDEAIEHYTELSNNLRCHGELYHLVWKDVYMTLHTLEGFKKARENRR